MSESLIEAVENLARRIQFVVSDLLELHTDPSVDESMLAELPSIASVFLEKTSKKDIEALQSFVEQIASASVSEEFKANVIKQAKATANFVTMALRDDPSHSSDLFSHASDKDDWEEPPVFAAFAAFNNRSNNRKSKKQSKKQSKKHNKQQFKQSKKRKQSRAPSIISGTVEDLVLLFGTRTEDKDGDKDIGWIKSIPEESEDIKTNYKSYRTPYRTPFSWEGD